MSQGGRVKSVDPDISMSREIVGAAVRHFQGYAGTRPWPAVAAYKNRTFNRNQLEVFSY